MKTNVIVEQENTSVSVNDIMAKLKKEWLDKGKKIKEMENVSIYVKVEDHTAYCVINENDKIAIPY